MQVFRYVSAFLAITATIFKYFATCKHGLPVTASNKVSLLRLLVPYPTSQILGFWLQQLLISGYVCQISLDRRGYTVVTNHSPNTRGLGQQRAVSFML